MFTSFYQRWIEDFDLVSLRETKINCAHCTMVVPPQNETLRDQGPFDPKLKCCTYSPFLPNFTVGALLSRKSLDPFARLGTRSLITPLGFVPKQSVDSDEFGKDLKSACGFLNLEAGTCAIWSMRPSVCASYHCVSSAGARGLAYWQKIEELGNLIEWTLAHESLWQLGFTQDETDEMVKASTFEIEDVSENEQSALIRASWQEWSGRERELFARAYELAKGVSSESLRHSLGERGESLVSEIRDLQLGSSRPKV